MSGMSASFIGKVILAGVLLTIIFVGVYAFQPQSGGRGGSGILPYNSGITGTITVGPTCPVVQDPPQEECADKPLATVVAVFRESDLVHAIAFTESDTEGKFEVSLPPGEYVVGAGESQLPSCPHTSAEVEPDSYTDIAISCDSGIR